MPAVIMLLRPSCLQYQQQPNAFDPLLRIPVAKLVHFLPHIVRLVQFVAVLQLMKSLALAPFLRGCHRVMHTRASKPHRGVDC